MPMPRLTSEVDPEIALPDARRNDGADHGIETGQKTPPGGTHQAQSQGSAQRGEGEREKDVAEHLRRHGGQDDASCPEPVDEGARRPDDGHAHDGRHGVQAAGCLDRERAHGVQGDEAQRQHQAGPQSLDNDGRQKESPVARQVVLEGRQRGRTGAGKVNGRSMAKATDNHRRGCSNGLGRQVRWLAERFWR
jgi:hypothetical protein